MRKCCSVLPGTNVVVIKREQRDPYLKSQGQGVSEYEFDSAFDDDATQQEVYEKTTKPYLKNLIAGLNVTVFAYGATGAGKTHTMMGNSRRDDATNHAEAGIIPNSLTDLFKQLEDKKHMAAPGERYDVSCSFMEVYNEQVYDLVEPTGKVLQICEDAVTKVTCSTEREPITITYPPPLTPSDTRFHTVVTPPVHHGPWPGDAAGTKPRGGVRAAGHR